MWFWILVLFGWLVVEWTLRRQAERKNDERFARLVAALNRYEAELKKLNSSRSDVGGSPSRGP